VSACSNLIDVARRCLSLIGKPWNEQDDRCGWPPPAETWAVSVRDGALVKLVALLLLLFAASWPAAADEEPMLDGPKAPVHEQVLSIPGDPARPVALEATLLMPDGPGPFHPSRSIRIARRVACRRCR
jgi:hypothetical protein